MLEECALRLRDLRFLSTTTMFGATFLLSTLPLIILISGLASQRVEDGLAHHLGLDARAAGIVGQLFRHPAHQAVGAMALALLLALAGSIGIAQLVQSSYEQIFGVEHARSGNLLRWLLWSAALLTWLGSTSAVSTVTRGVPGRAVLEGLSGLVIATAFFWWSMHLLLAGTQPWRRLLVPAVVTAVFWIVLEALAGLYFSSTITSDSRLYGTIGAVFSLLTWFIAIGVVVVLGALAGDIGQVRLAGWRTARRQS